MPKAKPTQVIVHRIELQETERATLEAALAGRFVTNAVSAAGSVLSGIGSALAPFGGVFAAIAGVYLADKALDEVLDMARDSGEAAKQHNLESYTEEANSRMSYFAALLQTYWQNDGMDGLIELLRQMSIYRNYTGLQITQIPTEFAPIIFPRWWSDICFNFLGTITRTDNTAGGAVTDPVELWSQWLTLEEYQTRAYYEETEGKASKGVWKYLFG
jgi:hypothetical protein